MKTKNIALAGGTVLVIITAISYMTLAEKHSVSKTKSAVVSEKHITNSTSVSSTSHRVKATFTSNINNYKVAKTKKAKQQLTDKKIATTPEVVAPAKKSLFSTDYLKMQEFTINTLRDTQLVAEGGMTVSIPAKAFSYKNGSEVEGKVTIQVKEAFKPEDIMLAGLLTKKGEELLESGGMYYLNAKANNEDVSIARDKQLTVEVPTPSKEAGMELYEGKQGAKGIDWTNPVVLNNQERDVAAAMKEAEGFFDMSTKNQMVKKEREKVEKAKTKNKKVLSDSLGWGNRTSEWQAGVIGNFNTGKQDTKLTYLMNTNRLGWANIDRLYHDPRSRQISFVTEVKNSEEFSDVYITMMFKSKRIYLPGYQKKDGTYSFTHGDFEEPVMPVGEKALVMVSAYKNGQQYFTIENITIEDNLSLTLVPQIMAEAEIKAIVNKSL